jgi:hypothetical protein
MAFFEKTKLIKTTTNGTFSRVLARIYSDLDVLPPPSTVVCPEKLRPMVSLIYRGHDLLWDPTFVGDHPEPVKNFKEERDRVMVAFTGGVDSLAAAMKVRISGRSPWLFHAQRINRAYPKEIEYASKIADGLSMHLIREKVEGSEKQPAYAESPLKNQLIMAMMVDAGIKHGISTYTSGIDSTNTIVESNVLYNWSDSAEMCDAFNVWVKSLFPQYSWEWSTKNRTESLKLIFEKNAAMFDFVMSCMTSHRFQVMRKEQVEKRFKFEVPGNRCGYCWKCCSDILHFVCFEMMTVPEEFVQHCLKIMRSNLPVVFGDAKTGYTDKQIAARYIDGTQVDNSKILKLLEG